MKVPFASLWTGEDGGVLQGSGLNLRMLIFVGHTYTPNPNRNRKETVTATELHRFVFGRPFTYEPNPWTKCKKMPVYFQLISLSDSRNTFTTQIVLCHCIKFVVFIVALGIVRQNSVVNSIVLVK